MRQQPNILLVISFLFLASCDFTNSDKKSQTDIDSSVEIVTEKSQTDDDFSMEILIDTIQEFERQDYERYKDICPDQWLEPKNYINKAFEKWDMNDQGKMLTKYSDMIRRQPGNPEGYFQRANILQRAIKGTGEAINDYRKAFALYFGNKEAVNDIHKEDFVRSLNAGNISFEKSDLDGDGYPEILLSRLDGIQNWQSFIVDKESDKWEIIDFEVGGEWFRNVHITDLNKNGIQDIIFEHLHGGMGAFGFRIYEYSQGQVTELGSEASKFIYRLGTIKIGDVDSDGLEEITCTYFVEHEELPVKQVEYYKWDGEKYSVVKELRVRGD